jgi:hypothetical protein
VNFDKFAHSCKKRNDSRIKVRRIKSGNDPVVIVVNDGFGSNMGFLVPITERDLAQDHVADLITKWREIGAYAFGSTFKPSKARTLDWINETLLPDPDRLLFLIYYKNFPIGHIGLRDLNCYCYQGDLLLRGEKGGGAMFMFNACRAFHLWAFDYFRVNFAWGCVRRDNLEGIRFNQQLGNQMADSTEVNPFNPTFRCGSNCCDETQLCPESMVRMVLTRETLFGGSPMLPLKR